MAGVLHKYVNITKGWRDRLFILADDKLVYFKVGSSVPSMYLNGCCKALMA